MSQELGSHRPIMEEGRPRDACGLCEGHAIEQADAKRAYTKAYLTNPNGISTLVMLPEDQWPKHWIGEDRKPMCRFVKALYGRPESGVHWEQHCGRHVMTQGFKTVSERQLCFFYDRLQFCLVIYLGGFKFSGPSENLIDGWEFLRHGINDTKGI